MECAKAVESAMRGNEYACKYMSCIEISTVDVKHFVIEKDYA